MSILCKHCGAKMEGMRCVEYEVEFLEKYLEDYFGWSKDELSTNNYRKKGFNRFRSISFRIILDFSGLKHKGVVDRYRVSFATVTRVIRITDPNDHDYLFIKKDLLDELPKTEE